MPSLEILSRSECIDFLAAGRVGRLAFVVDDRPEIFPINYALDGETVLFRTAAGTILSQAGLREVAFEVDHIDEKTRSGWSVVVQGHADDIAGAIDATSERLRQLPLITWAPGQRGHWFAIRARSISGRRLRVLPLEQ